MRGLLIIALLLAGCSGSSEFGVVDASLGTSSPAPATNEPLATEQPVVSDDPTADPLVDDLSVKVTKRTTSVAPGATASVSIKTTKKASCGIDVQYESGSSTAKGLGDKTADSAGAITWKWTVGSKTHKGSVPVLITCSLGDRYGNVDTDITVK